MVGTPAAFANGVTEAVRQTDPPGSLAFSRPASSDEKVQLDSSLSHLLTAGAETRPMKASHSACL